MVEPIKPEDVQASHATTIPDEVIEAFNEMIVRNWSPTTQSASFTQSDVMDLILDKMGLERGTSARSDKRGELYRLHHLDVEPLFRDQGWRVTYDKPAYNETYPASFEFEKPRR